MRRREFISLIGGAAAWPLAPRAQQPVIPVVGFLTSLGQNERPNPRDAFRRGLSEVGFVEGRNVIVHRTGEADYPREVRSGFAERGEAVRFLDALVASGAQLPTMHGFRELVAPELWSEVGIFLPGLSV